VLAWFRLVSKLRYRALPELVGRSIEVPGVDAVVPALRALIEPWAGPDAPWAPGCNWAEEHLHGTIGKYGLIDTWFAAPASLLNGALAGRAVLKANGIDEGDDSGEGISVEDLAKDFDPSSCVLKLYLQDRIPYDVRRTWRDGEPAVFPRRFTVEDACATNARGVWGSKYFYM
jgi:hypothetical protein